SPYNSGKGKEREELIAGRAKENGVIVAYVNLVGGQDELIFDGGSSIYDAKGNLLARGKQFDEDFILCDLQVSKKHESRSTKQEGPSPWKTQIIDLKEDHKSADPDSPFAKHSAGRITNHKTRKEYPPIPLRKINRLDPLEEVYQALVLGTKDYVRKNGFQKVVLGLSGGIDSSLTTAIAVDALKKESVIGVFMPSQYSSRESEEDVKELVKRLNIQSLCIPIADTFFSYRKMMAKPFKGSKEDITEENLQARIRGNILMALSNKFGWLVLTTGNKSEVSVGYCTLYGDTAGGFAILKDVPKTLVYKLARYRNSLDREIIPKRVLTKPPTAELKPNQKDEDTLPPYELLDPILEAYVEEDKEVDEIVGMGYDRETVNRVAEMVNQNEYKRRQAPPGIKITPKAFGKDRRLPITNKYRRNRNHDPPKAEQD
ncbi:NAD+ synthase, partial [candidate division TA06 bacterium]|nr:NAD+ synthase [candidate division TA06 bacterium]